MLDGSSDHLQVLQRHEGRIFTDGDTVDDIQQVGQDYLAGQVQIGHACQTLDGGHGVAMALQCQPTTNQPVRCDLLNGHPGHLVNLLDLRLQDAAIS